MGALPELNTLWIGDALSPIHRLCLLSAVRHGHHVRLFCYERPGNVPSDIEVSPADDIIPRSSLFLHRHTASPAPFADRFRIRLISLGLGLWVDTDVLFLAPLNLPRCNIFGWENKRLVGNAVLGFDPQGSLFRMLKQSVDDDYLIPPWASGPKAIYYKARRMLGRPVHVMDMPYGTTGPDLLTWCVRQTAALDKVLPQEVFYSLPYEQKLEAFKRVESTRPAPWPTINSIAVHLWFQGLLGGVSASIAARKSLPEVEPGSLIHRVAMELGMANELSAVP